MREKRKIRNDKESLKKFKFILSLPFSHTLFQDPFYSFKLPLTIFLYLSSSSPAFSSSFSFTLSLTLFLFSFFISFIFSFSHLIYLFNKFASLCAFSLFYPFSFLSFLSQNYQKDPLPEPPVRCPTSQDTNKIYKKKYKRTTYNVNLNEIKYLFIDNIYLFTFRKMLDDNPFVMILLIIIALFIYLYIYDFL